MSRQLRGMGNMRKGDGKQGRGVTAKESFSSSQPTPSPGQPRLKLNFFGTKKPQLDWIEFYAEDSSRPTQLKQNAKEKANAFLWGAMTQALSLLFIEYRCAGIEGRGDEFRFEGLKGSLAATLCNEIARKTGKLFTLFQNTAAGAEDDSRVSHVFTPQNTWAPDELERRVWVHSEYLPPENVEIIWLGQPQNTADELRALNALIRSAWELEPSRQPPPPPPKVPHSKPQLEPHTPIPEPREELKASPPPPTAAETKASPQPPPVVAPPTPEEKPLPPIDARLFLVPEEEPLWPDELPLMDFGEECPIWTLSDAFAGVLILGATNSGKTSGSGDALASTFLKSGFGGLVLTVKKDEADHWRRLCAENGREQDLVIIGADGKWKFNILAYQAQRPGRGGGLAKNLVTFCRNLLKLSARGSRGGGTNEEFWVTATDQLFEALFELFLLARQPLSFDRLSKFVVMAPTTPNATHDPQLQASTFGQVFEAAEKSLSDEEDRRLFGQVHDYWFRIFPMMPTKIRTTITLGVTAMFDAFRGRDLPGVISAETNVTPEMALRGKIIVVDFPLKEYEQAGLLIQSAIKYVFQTALERQASARNARRRPVFIFEDEASHFVSEHDKHFQATARSARVSRVVITQNVNSFYSEFGPAVTNTIFGNLNTKIFHQNSDYDSNLYASHIFGNEIVLRSSMSVNPQKQANDIVGQLYQTHLPESSVSHTEAEHLEPAVPPEAFNQLRNGGPRNNFQVEAYVTWLGMADGGGRHFTQTTFLQKTSGQSYERESKRQNFLTKFLRKIIGSV